MGGYSGYQCFHMDTPVAEMDRNTHWKYRRLPGMGYPEVGDIVVFNSPENMDQLLVKRITRIKKENDTFTYQTGELSVPEKTNCRGGKRCENEKPCCLYKWHL